MTKKRIPESSHRMTRRRLMFASAAGASLLKNGVAAGQDDDTGEGAREHADNCARSRAVVKDITIAQLFGKNTKRFAEIIHAAINRKDPVLEPQDITKLNEVLIKLEAAEAKHGAIHYRDFFTKSPENWGGELAGAVINAMESDNGRFFQPHLLHQDMPQSVRNQTGRILDGWTTSSGKEAAGFIDLCGQETVERAFSRRHFGLSSYWIDEHLINWILKHHVGWPCHDDAGHDGQQAGQNQSSRRPYANGKCVFYDAVNGVYACDSRPDSTCKIENGQPTQGSDYCPPPES